MGIFEHYQQRYESFKQEELTIQEYLELCKTNPTTYANSAERLIQAIGEPEMVDAV